MKKQRLGTLEISTLGLGCMGMTGFYGKADPKQCTQTIHAAIEQGVTFFDTADNYGFGENESLLGAAIRPFRDRVVIATKVGVVRKKETPQVISINGTPEYIKKSCADSLKRLGISTIDLYYLHHADPNTPIEESIHAMVQLVHEGKVRCIGLGEMSPEQIRRASKIHPIAAVQMEYSLFSRDAESQIIPLCKELGIRLVACAPLCRCLLGGQIHSFDRLASDDARRMLPRFKPEALTHNFKIVSTLKKIAQSKSITMSQLALAWVACQPDIIVPLFGTTSVVHLQENIKSALVKLTKKDIDAINAIVSKDMVQGSRLPEMVKQLYKTN